jgi:hypothetical protein
MEVGALLLYPWRMNPQYPLDRRLFGPIASLDAVENRKIIPLLGI